MSLTEVQQAYPTVRRADHAPCGACGQTSPYRRYVMGDIEQPVCWRCWLAIHCQIEDELRIEAAETDYDKRHPWGQGL